jgi:uncharacterized protein (DUF427 family)
MDCKRSESKEIRVPGPDHPVTISPAEGKVHVTVAGRTVAESTRALRLDENGHPPSYYVPRSDSGRPITFSTVRTSNRAVRAFSS